MGLGAYSSVLLTKAGVSFWLALPIAGLVAGLGGFLMSPIIKLKGVYFAMASLAFSIAIYVVFVNWDGVTNGTKGIIDIPYPKLGPIVIRFGKELHNPRNTCAVGPVEVFQEHHGFGLRQDTQGLAG